MIRRPPKSPLFPYPTLSRSRALVKGVGGGTGPGQPRLYGTTIRFLQLLGLSSLDDLPFPETQELPEPAEPPDLRDLPESAGQVPAAVATDSAATAAGPGEEILSPSGRTATRPRPA